MSNPYARVQILLGEQAFARLREAHVVVVGYGAVGSFAAEALVRSGVGHIRIIDADVYDESNINRQLGAQQNTVGRVKVSVGGEHLRGLDPELDLESVESYVDESTLECVTRPFELDGVLPEIVIDAIDTIDAKLSLLIHCYRCGIKVISSMGAARKVCPELIRYGDISQTEVCPLAREVRKRLRRAGIERGISCVYSLERVVGSTHGTRDLNGSGVVHRPQLGSLVTVTGSFGLRLASESIRMLLGTE